MFISIGRLNMTPIYQTSTSLTLIHLKLQNRIFIGGLTIMPCCTSLALTFLSLKSASLFSNRSCVTGIWQGSKWDANIWSKTGILSVLYYYIKTGGLSPGAESIVSVVLQSGALFFYHPIPLPTLESVFYSPCLRVMQSNECISAQALEDQGE